MAQNGAISEVQLVRGAIELILGRLPGGWRLESLNEASGARKVPDAALVLSSPDGRSLRIEVEVKRGPIAGRQALALAQDLHSRAAAVGAVPLLVTRYLSPEVRERLRGVGVSYVDATGNVMLSAINPALFLSDRGADTDPWRGAGRPRGTLRGEPAARVTRALLDYSRSWRVRELIEASGASTGATYRVLEYLEREGLIERSERGAWLVPEWELLLRAWARDYAYLKDNAVSRFIDARGIDHFRQVLAGSASTYAVTGAAAVAGVSAIAPVRSLFIYVADAERVAEEGGLRHTEAGVNVVLLQPPRPEAFVFSRTIASDGGLACVSKAQAAVDLLNGPGRDPQVGEDLLIWMREHESEWRL